MAVSFAPGAVFGFQKVFFLHKPFPIPEKMIYFAVINAPKIMFIL